MNEVNVIYREKLLSPDCKQLLLLFLGKKPEIPKDDEEEWRKCPFEMWDRNPVFPPLSDALGIHFDDVGGRHIIATRNIIAGEPVVIEEPVSAHLSPCFMAANCIHCLRRNGHSVLPSPVNVRARYISFFLKYIICNVGTDANTIENRF